MNIKANAAFREELAVSNNIEQFRSVVSKVKAKYEPFHEGAQVYITEEFDQSVPVVENGVNYIFSFLLFLLFLFN